VDVQAGFGLAVDLAGEVAEVGRPVLGGQLADDLAGGDVQRGEQVHSSVPHVAGAAPLGHAGHHRQHRGGALQRLDLRLLVHAEDRRVGRRGQVQAHHVPDLAGQQRVRGNLEGLGPPGLEPERPPDPQHAGGRDAHPPGQLPLRPVRGAFGDLLQRAHHYLLYLGIADGARHPRTRLIRQPVEPPGQETRPPSADRVAIDAQPRRDREVAAALRAGQHDPRPQRQALRGAAALDPVL